ncbi:MAG TPA: carbohydrate kinase family protein [Actinocrinis sp.]|uniref:carbohydrate kinase family protein n=1 Tax=Actinocrinis sp. TaxID=1920516 RepID=UPI002DDD499E|nr:carbohydrate kinase family protein [Actinocrinis sp.]HEV2344597.1 carbohydrate kinase family protein [Actinocrinis sp.]
MSSRIVVVGVASLYLTMPVERFPIPYAPTRQPQWAHVGVGGIGSHVARVLGALGDQVSLCSVVGDDLAGVAIRRELARHGLDGPAVVTGPSSSMGLVLVDSSGKRAGHPFLRAVDAVEYPPDVFDRAAQGADMAVITNTVFARALLPRAKRLNLPVAVDVHLIGSLDDPYDRPWLEAADVLFCSHESLPCSPRNWIGRVFARYQGCTIVAVGRGAHGSMLGLRDGTLVEARAAPPRGVVNTTGAGDALFASFLHGWLATGNAAQSLAQAVLFAGWKIGEASPVEATLTAAQLEQLRADHPVQVSVSRWDRGRGRCEPAA